VLERILVLAVAQEVGRDETKPRVVNAVTLEVTPAQAENLDLARSVGTLSLALRNQVDPRPGVTDGATKVTLLGAHGTPAAPALVPALVPSPAEPVAVAKPRAQLASAAPRACIGVIAGVQRTQECL
jgi:pilus assembly protein CpaB